MMKVRKVMFKLLAGVSVKFFLPARKFIPLGLALYLLGCGSSFDNEVSGLTAPPAVNAVAPEFTPTSEPVVQPTPGPVAQPTPGPVAGPASGPLTGSTPEPIVIGQ